MALHPNFPSSPHAILDPSLRWFPADEALRTTSFEKLLPPLVPELRRQVKSWRDSGYAKATETSRTLLNWWFIKTHLLPKADGTLAEFQYYFAQREALETIVYLYDVETKGQEDLDVPLKMARLRQWCEDINRVQQRVKYSFVFVDQENFEKYKPVSFKTLMAGFREYQ